MKRFWHLFWIFTLIIIALQMFFLFPEMPRRIPTHFDFQGNPDGWSSKDSFLLIMIVTLVALNIWYPLTGFMVRKFPRSLINIPNKDYWYATPQRIEQMLAVLKVMMAMIFGLMNVIFIYMLYYTYQMAMERTPALNFWFIFAPIILISIYPIVYLYKKLKIPTNSGSYQ